MVPKGYEELQTAQTLLHDRKPEDAFETLKRAVTAHPELPPARLLMALLFFAAGNNAQGTSLLEQAAAESPEHPEVLSALGKLAIAEHRHAYSRLAFEKAVALKLPTNWGDARRHQFEATCQEGLSLLAESRQDWSEAHVRLTRLIELDPKNGPAHHRLARALFWLNKPDQAISELRAGSRLDPLLEPPAVAMGRLYAQNRNTSKAAEWLDNAVKENPKDPRVRMATANWLLEQGKAEEASEQLKLARSLQGSTREFQRLQGLIARQLTDYPEAEAAFQSLLQESPGDMFASDQLALVLADQEDPTKKSRALQLAELNARAFPNDPETLSTLGWVLFRTGRVEDAERALRAAASRGPIGSDTAYFLARVLAARGLINDARALIQTALQTPGTFISRRDAKQWLRVIPRALSSAGLAQPRAGHRDRAPPLGSRIPVQAT